MGGVWNMVDFSMLVLGYNYLVVLRVTCFWTNLTGNGDILSYEDAILRKEQTGVSGLMIAR